jgi:hypothetical protein
MTGPVLALIAWSFLCADTPVDASQAPRLYRGHGTGFVASSASEQRMLPTLALQPGADLDYPKTVMLTDYMPEPLDQGRQSSDVAFALVYCLTDTVFKRYKLSDMLLWEFGWRFCPSFLYDLTSRGKDNGVTVPEAIGVLRDQGCCTIQEMGFDNRHCDRLPDEHALERAAAFRLGDEIPVRLSSGNPALIKAFLASVDRPLLIAAELPDDWPESSVANDAVYTAGSDAKTVATHAMTVVGYDEARHAFRLFNSWGATWGDQGYLWVSEEFVRDHTVEAWGLVPGALLPKGGSVSQPLGRALAFVAAPG